jgi:dTDP-4-dehydrorhamnose reductase
VSIPGPILVTGANGLLGWAFVRLCEDLSIRCFGYSHTELDITNPTAVRETISRFARLPTGGAGGQALVINAAAFTDVDRAEEEEEHAFAVNDAGATNVARAAADRGLGLVHLSTDFVFDGTKNSPYTEDDEPNPLSVYGRSKLAGDRSVAVAHPDVLIIRTAWVYGPGGRNFPQKIAELARQQDEVKVVTDHCGSPTASSDLARGMLELWDRGARGLFHLAGSGWCSRYELAQATIEAVGLSTKLVPIHSRDFPTRAPRPANSVLCLDKARRLGVELPPWRDSLVNYVRHHLLQIADTGRRAGAEANEA